MLKNFFRLNKLLFVIPLTTLMFCFNAPKGDDEKMQIIMTSVAKTLQFAHYSPKPINDAYSQEVYKDYLEVLDPAKRFFLQSDMEEFSKHKTKLDDYFLKGDLTFYKLTVDRLYKRVDEIDLLTQEIFKGQIDLNEDETMILEPKMKNHPDSKEDLKKEWKKYIKYNILREIEALNSKEETQRKKKDSVIANKLQDTIKLEVLSFEQKKQKATDEVKDLMSDVFRRFKKRKKMDWFTVYMNSYTEIFDPHSSYFSPTDKEDFDANFTGKLIGIGAQIQEKRGNLYVGPLVIGAPAWKSKQVDEGDKILKVKSKPGEPPVNVVGMLVDEAVRLIRGKEGTEVVLTLEKKDGTIKDVKLIREEVSIEDTFAKSIVVTSPKGTKYGFIHLPSFNADFEDAKGRNASDDVKAEILKLKKQGIKGIILDLRNNGGGSLTEVVDIMGLFMNSGPAVQVKSGRDNIEVLKNKLNEPIWDGPLLIMQSEASASASEILAGAVQDYGRGVILGAPTSYGKGTVQTFLPLNRFLSAKDDFGAIKITIQKFYRVTGNSTQLKGVSSDIVMEDFLSYAEVGERYQDYALPWDQIASTKFTKMNGINIPSLVKNSKARLQTNKNYQLLIESAKWRKDLDNEKEISLNYNKFAELAKSRKNQVEKFKTLSKYDNSLKFSQSPDEVARIKTDEVFAKKSENWIKSLKRDLHLEEAIHVISEMK